MSFARAAAAALDAAEVETRQVEEIIDFRFPYLMMNDVMRVVKDLSPRIVSQQFDNDCTIRLAIRRSMAEELRSRLGVGGKASPGPSEGGEGLAG